MNEGRIPHLLQYEELLMLRNALESQAAGITHAVPQVAREVLEEDQEIL